MNIEQETSNFEVLYTMCGSALSLKLWSVGDLKRQSLGDALRRLGMVSGRKQWAR